MNRLTHTLHWAAGFLAALVTAGCSGDDGGPVGADGDRLLGTVLYVDQYATSSGDGKTWAAAFTSLQQALLTAGQTPDPEEIWVAAGTYSGAAPGEEAAAFSLVDDVYLFGGFAGTETSRGQRDWVANLTVLDGAGAPRVIAARLTSGGTLDGFTVTGGAGSQYGAGAFFEISSLDQPPTVRNCRFEGNRATGAEGHSAFGGGLYCNRGTEVTDCVFVGNRGDVGGGMHMGSIPGDVLVVANCAFYGNGRGGALYSGGALSMWTSDSEALIVNCVFSGNESDFAAVSVVGAVTVANCSFHANTTRLSKGTSGLRVSSSAATVANCILYGNVNADSDTDGNPETAQLRGDHNSTLTVRHCCIEGLESWPGNGNKDSAPAFRDADGNDEVAGTVDDDLHLSGDSPCLNTGDADQLPRDAGDLDGDGNRGEPTPVDLDRRPRGASVSMGAYN
jgi:hypothetical protein